MGDQLQLLFALNAGNLEYFMTLPGAAGMAARLETEKVRWEYLQLTEKVFSEDGGRKAESAGIPQAVKSLILRGDLPVGHFDVGGLLERNSVGFDLLVDVQAIMVVDGSGDDQREDQDARKDSGEGKKPAGAVF